MGLGTLFFSGPMYYSNIGPSFLNLQTSHEALVSVIGAAAPGTTGQAPSRSLSLFFLFPQYPPWGGPIGSEAS